MNDFEDLLRRDLQATAERNAFDVDVDPVLDDGRRIVRRRALGTAALGVAVVAAIGALVLRPAPDQVASPAPTPSVAAPTASASPTASPPPSPTASGASSPGVSDGGGTPPSAQAVHDVTRWATPSVDFASPSTRIECSMTSDRVECAIPMEFAGTRPADVECPDGPGRPTYVGVGQGAAEYGCAGDPAAFPTRSGGTSWMESGLGAWVASPYHGSGEEVATLPYGTTLRVGAMTCASAETGVTCTNTATGHSMSLNRERIVLG